MGYVIAYGFALAAIFTVVAWIAALGLPKQLRVFQPNATQRKLAILSSLPLPISALGMAVAPWIPYFNGTHRGPEVVLIYILGFAFIVVVLIGWPLLYRSILFRLQRQLNRTEASE